ncbi:unnamed protein product, partial [Scytosiphon promiscuus]
SSSSSSLPRSSPETPTTPPSGQAPAKRQRHSYRKGGEVLYIAEGVAQAALGLVRDPVRGAQADGARGLVRGLGSGVFGVVLKPAKGVAKAGANAYTGVRIGVSKAGRVVVGGSRSGNGGAGSSASKTPQGEAEVGHFSEGGSSRGNNRPRQGREQAQQSLPSSSYCGTAAAAAAAPTSVAGGEARRVGGGGLERLVAAGNLAPEDASEAAVFGDTGTAVGARPMSRWKASGRGAGGAAGGGKHGPGGNTLGGTGGAGTRSASSVGFYSRLPPFDGLVVGVAVVPIVVASVFLLASVELSSGNRSASEGYREAGHGNEGRAPPTYCSSSYSERVDGDGDGADAAEVMALACADGAGLVAYLEVMLESSILCAVWEVMFAVQRVLRWTAGKEATSRAVWLRLRLLSSRPLRLIVICCGCLLFCRRPLLPLWCVALYDVLRRALDLRRGRQMRRMSLRPGETAILAQALALWAVDACAYTIQKLWVVESMPWEEVVPRIPARSGYMVVVQTGLIGTLGTGLAMMLIDQLTPAAWRSRGHSWQNVILTYGALIGSIAAWLTCWTTPLLGSSAIPWVLLYALGYPDPTAAAERAGQAIQSQAANHAAAGGWSATVVAARFSAALQWALSDLKSSAMMGAEEAGGVAREGMSGSRPLLVAGWVLALAVCVPLVPQLSKRFAMLRSKTSSRKLFHLLATAMFLPGLFASERDFLSLALGVAFGVMLALEFLRCADCPPMAAVLDRYYGRFLDGRDGGVLIVTHLFLLLGCAVPVWLSGLTSNRFGDVVDGVGLLPYAGVIVLGVGDAMGAVVGCRVGRLNWPSSRRTLEGSAAVFTTTLGSLLLVAWVLAWQESGKKDGSAGIEWRAVATNLAWPVALSTLMEAFTTQVDNLILPCVLFSCLALRQA